jgi:hypothetical protein
MTLRQFFESIQNNPNPYFYYFLAVPIVCAILWLLFNTQETAYKIRYVFSVICFASFIPGLFALTLNIYTFLFERQSVWDMNLVSQVLPVISMVLSFLIIKKTLEFEYIPGFEKITSLSAIVFVVMGVLWFIDRTRIFAFVNLPFSAIVIGFVALIIFVKYGFSRLL